VLYGVFVDEIFVANCDGGQEKGGCARDAL
jgi:hypothetical protein